LTSIFLLLSAFLTWQLGRHEASPALAPVAGALFLSYLGAIISWTYFSPGPRMVATVVAIILGFKVLHKTHQTRPG